MFCQPVKTSCQPGYSCQLIAPPLQPLYQRTERFSSWTSLKGTTQKIRVLCGISLQEKQKYQVKDFGMNYVKITLVITFLISDQCLLNLK